MMKQKFKAIGSAVALGLAGLALAGQAQATTFVLEGSDATALHGDVGYTDQLIAFLREGSALPVAVFNPSGGSLPSGTTGITYVTSLTGLSTATFSALYIVAPGGCCSSSIAAASAFTTEIAAFYAGGTGGSVAIEDYIGGGAGSFDVGADWSFIDPVGLAGLAAPPAGAIQGHATGGGGPSCTDGEVFNAEGLAKGFTQPPALGCWEHQAYDVAYFGPGGAFGPLGFLSLVDSAPGYSFPGLGSAFLALGGSLGTPGCTDPRGCAPGTSVPTPATLGLLGAGLLGLAGLRRRQAA